jgi:predicted HAD superfamily Cof-like phosphohydrolase
MVEDQKTFMEATNQTIHVNNSEQSKTYIALCREEAAELQLAYTQEPLENILKEAIDNIVVNIGLILSYGIDPYAIWTLVWKHNMLKTKNFVKNEEGKVLQTTSSKAAKQTMLQNIRELIG